VLVEQFDLAKSASVNGCGRDTYKGAKLSVLQEGAWADMLLVDGDPTQDINVLKDYERNFVVITVSSRMREPRSVTKSV